MNRCDRFLVLTGGPGSGKTTLAAALAREGIATMPESGRAVIRDQRAAGGRALPWDDRAAYAREMARRDIANWHAARRLDGPVVFDRGLGDVIGYLRLCDLPVPPGLLAEARSYPYAQSVLLAPHWPEIYRNDTERLQDETEARATCTAVAAAWEELGYELAELPRAPVAERVRFVLATLR